MYKESSIYNSCRTWNIEKYNLIIYTLLIPWLYYTYNYKISKYILSCVVSRRLCGSYTTTNLRIVQPSHHKAIQKVWWWLTKVQVFGWYIVYPCFHNYRTRTIRMVTPKLAWKTAKAFYAYPYYLRN